MTALPEKLYFKEVGKYMPLTDEQEAALVLRVQKREKVAIDDLIRANLRFVISVARRYTGRGLTLMELVNEGNVGLYRAAKKFNPEKKVRFISYAVWWIRQAIQQALFDQVCTIKIPTSKMAMVLRFKRALEECDGNFNKAMERKEFRDHESEIVEVLEKMATYSLDAPIRNDSEPGNVDTLLDMIGQGPDQDVETERKELSQVINHILGRLTDREEKIIRMYYGINYSHEYTLDEIGKELSLTRERVRQIKTKTLRKLMRSRNFKGQVAPYLGDHEEEPPLI